MDERSYSLPNLVLSFQMTIKSRRDVLLEALDRVMSLVQTLPCVQGDLDDVRLALAEVLSNAVTHGNREDSDKTVDICAGCDGRSQLLIAVTDQGDGFDPYSLVRPNGSREHLFESRPWRVSHEASRGRS
jgi:anti-sigma regulatory factor (Ser/Thr protein kinase)